MNKYTCPSCGQLTASLVSTNSLRIVRCEGITDVSAKLPFIKAICPRCQRAYQKANGQLRRIEEGDLRGCERFHISIELSLRWNDPDNIASNQYEIMNVLVMNAKSTGAENWITFDCDEKPIFIGVTVVHRDKTNYVTKVIEGFRRPDDGNE